jgi:hypothetical protein
VAMAVPLVAGQPKFNEAKERTKFQQLSPETLYTNHTTMKHQRHNTTVIIINFSETINKKKKNQRSQKFTQDILRASNSIGSPRTSLRRRARHHCQMTGGWNWTVKTASFR